MCTKCWDPIRENWPEDWQFITPFQKANNDMTYEAGLRHSQGEKAPLEDLAERFTEFRIMRG